MGFYLAQAILLSSMASTAFGASIDPCTGREVQNSWILTVNEADESSRDHLLDTLRLLGSKGFQPAFVMSSERNAAVIFGVTFDTTQFRNTSDAEAAKTSTLGTLITLPGNRLECNDLSLPGMGIRN